MERNLKALLLVPLALLCVGAVGPKDCPSDPDAQLTCHNDYNRIITCVWTGPSGGPDHGSCSVFALDITQRATRRRRNITTKAAVKEDLQNSSSCTLDAARPSTCVMNFNRDGQFQDFSVLSINLTCKTGKHTWKTYIQTYKPACHIKMKPPPQPNINSTVIFWVPRAAELGRLSSFTSQLQWKRRDQPWTDAYKQENNFSKDSPVELQLDPDHLTQGERYEARVRVMTNDRNKESTWSDWSPVASWVSLAGQREPRPSDLNVAVLVLVAAAAAFTVFLVVVRFKTDKTTWVYMMKSITGPPLPNPAKSFLQDADFQSWLSPHFTGESFHSLHKPVEVESVEVTSSVDGVAPCGPEASLLEKMRSDSSHESTSSNFSNPSYSQLCPPPPPLPPPVSSLTAGNLAPCVADTPYGPVGGRDETAEQEVRGQEEAEVRLLLSGGGNGGESMPLVSDYEAAEKVQVERVRLQSLDSGVCSGEEVSQESLEADSMNVTEGEEDEEEEEEEESEGGGGKEVDFQKLFGGGGGGIFGDGSIRVCSGYERVQTLQPGGPELLSTDSGVSGVGEEEEVDESTCLLPPPPPCSSSPCFLPLFPPPDFSGSGLSPALQPLPSLLLQRTALTVEPSGDGYL